MVRSGKTLTYYISMFPLKPLTVIKWSMAWVQGRPQKVQVD
jgi:hypothetical protein